MTPLPYTTQIYSPTKFLNKSTVTMAYNSGGSNPIGAKTGPRPEDAHVPPVNRETLKSIEKKEDDATDNGESKREGVVGTQLFI
jgi:hypothetical protein